MSENGVAGDVAYRVVIEGRVQGVWYRGWTAEQAEARGLCGWVRNRRDGTVEALFSGPEEAVEDMLKACLQGPKLAVVAKIGKSIAAPPHETEFLTLPTT